MSTNCHVHIVGSVDDKGEAAGSVSVAALLGHLTLRCGTLPSVEVSASRVPWTEGGKSGTSSRTIKANLAVPGATQDDEVVLTLLGEALQGKTTIDTTSGTIPVSVEPYDPLSVSFPLSFQEMEARLEHSVGSGDCAVEYFGILVAADLPAYEYLLRFYQRKREKETSRRTPPVLALYVALEEPSRHCLLVEQLLEGILSSKEGRRSDRPCWLNQVDDSIFRFALISGVDALASVV